MIPDFQTVMRPALGLLQDGETHRGRDLVDAIADIFGVTDDERLERIASGQPKIRNRVNWALTYLYQAGLTERPQRGHARITELGRQALKEFPDRIDMRALERYPAYLEFKGRTRRSREVDPGESLTNQSPATPQDLLDEALKENRAVLQSELLQRALGLPPVGFEDLVMRLLGAMGYGQAGRVERTSATGDAGIDGIISQDPLGLDRIYVQAKRYREDLTVHQPAIAAFVGALDLAQGDRGVFITTSSFSSGARTAADQSSRRIELIDGSRLTDLLVRHGVGVQPEIVVTLHQIDEDFFESL